MSGYFVAGHNGLVGKAIVRAIRARGDEVLTANRSELDLRNREAVRGWLRANKPDTLILAAARVGGIAANMADPVGFLIDNLDIQNVVMTEAVDAGVSSTVFLGSSCIYPRNTAQPMHESQLWSGPLEPTNESYAVAKLAGIQLARSLQEQHGVLHINPQPSNVYGPGDHFEFERSHVVSALVRRFVDAQRENKSDLTLWGTGNARRELLHCDDLAEAILYLLDKRVGPDPINVGTGEDVSIQELAEMIAELVGFEGTISWDTSKPDGMPQKVLDVSRVHEAGWQHKRALRDGLGDVIADYHSTSQRR